jgi:hypothetical protein
MDRDVEHREFKDRLPLEEGGVDYVEHSKNSRAKKVIHAGYVVQDENKSVPATAENLRIQPAIDLTLNSGTNKLERSCAYRVISDGIFRYRLHNGASAQAATGVGVFVPANTVEIIFMKQYEYITIADDAGTFVHAHKLV